MGSAEECNESVQCNYLLINSCNLRYEHDGGEYVQVVDLSVNADQKIQ